MRPFRLLLLVAGVVALLVAIGVAVVFSSSFQTWAARKAIAAQPDLNLRLGSVDAGLGRVRLEDVRYERDGAVLALPAVDAELPVLSALFSEKVSVSSLVAKGWTLDLPKRPMTGVAGSVATPEAGGPTKPAAAPTPAPAPDPIAGAAAAFSGVFASLRLPVDFSLDGVQLEGEIVLPDSRSRIRTAIRGGGLGAMREGRFELAADAALADPKVNAVSVRGAIVAAMDTPRSFTQLAVKLDASATGAQLPAGGVKLTAGVTAARAATGETYSATLVSHDRQLIALKADFPRDASRLDGTWKLDVRDVDVAPFAFGHPLPAFTAVGEGRFDTDAAFDALHATGRLNATAGRLEVLKPQLAAVGAVRVAAQFDLARRGDLIAVQQVEAAVSAAQPVATITALQGFEFNPRTGELNAGDPARELVGIVLHGVPLAWAQPFLRDVELSGGEIRGEVVANARGGGVALRARVPLAVERVSVAQSGKPLVRELDLKLDATADYTPQGWQAEVLGFSARRGATQLFALSGKAGQLAGPAQPVKAAGKASADLGAMLEQPLAAGMLELTSGEANVEFVASAGEKLESQTTVALTKLATAVDGKPVALPSLTADIRADVAAGGAIALNAPIRLERDGRKSDLTLVGSLAPEKNKVRAIELQLTSSQLVLDDAKLFAAVASAAGKSEKSDDDRGEAPLWAGLRGDIALKLQKVVYSEAFEMTNVGGRIRFDAGTVKLETVQAGIGSAGRAALNGTMTFDPAKPEPFALVADLTLRDFDPGPFFKAAAPDRPPTLEGVFDITSKLASRAQSLDALVPGVSGIFQLTSKGGVFRGLPVNAATLAENTSRIASLLASAGTALGALTGKKDELDIANKAQALAEVAKGLSAIAFDQLSMSVTRDADFDLEVQHFALISPELRLTGHGATKHEPGTAWLDDTIAMEFTLRAQGRQGELLRYLGALEPQTDDLGYALCTLPLKVGGTLRQPDTTELNGKLASLALEKSGVTEKASELLNKMFGGSGK